MSQALALHQNKWQRANAQINIFIFSFLFCLKLGNNDSLAFNDHLMITIMMMIMMIKTEEQDNHVDFAQKCKQHMCAFSYFLSCKYQECSLLHLSTVKIAMMVTSPRECYPRRQWFFYFFSLKDGLSQEAATESGCLWPSRPPASRVRKRFWHFFFNFYS